MGEKDNGIMRVTQDPVLKLSDDIGSFSDSLSFPRPAKETGRRSSGGNGNNSVGLPPQQPIPGPEHDKDKPVDNGSAFGCEHGGLGLGLGLNNSGGAAHAGGSGSSGSGGHGSGPGLGPNNNSGGAHAITVGGEHGGRGGHHGSGSGSASGLGFGQIGNIAAVKAHGAPPLREVSREPSGVSAQTDDRGTNNAAVEVYDHIRCVMCKQKPLDSHISARCGHMACHACWDKWL